VLTSGKHFYKNLIGGKLIMKRITHNIGSFTSLADLSTKWFDTQKIIKSPVAFYR